ncbi:MAG: PEPxxWA-CTERM sorting domain-containing protein [Qipengyuania sp.]|nr:PEPxxWA-CTERM sorting domain-containing protein [Qipengyuania sp.]
MKLFTRVSLVALAAAVAVPASAVTHIAFVGSWRVDDGPNWTVVPPAYTGQAAAALLFGGLASDYYISTVDNTVGNIDRQSWVSTWGGACGGSFPCGTKVADTFAQSTGGLYQNPGDTSAYVNDWAIGPEYTNYAFRVGVVPEPATWALLILGFGLTGAAMRRTRRSVRVGFA